MVHKRRTNVKLDARDPRWIYLFSAAVFLFMLIYHIVTAASASAQVALVPTPICTTTPEGDDVCYTGTNDLTPTVEKTFTPFVPTSTPTLLATVVIATPTPTATQQPIIRPLQDKKAYMPVVHR